MNRLVALAVGVLVIGSFAMQAGAVPYSDPTKVDLLRRVDQNGNLVSAATSPTHPGDYAHGAARINDAGLQPWRIDGHAATETFQIALPEAVSMTKFDMNMRGGFIASDFKIRGSTTGFGSMSDLVTVTGNTDAHPTYTIPATPVKYLEVPATGFQSSFYYIFYEMSAYGTAPVEQRSGYNMFAEPGMVDTVTPSMGHGIMDNDGGGAPLVSQVTDGDVGTFVRGTGASGDSWFVTPLKQSKELMAMSVGMYEDQSFSDLQVYVSNDASYSYDSGSGTWPGMTWTKVFDHDQGTLGNFAGTHFTMTPQDVKFIRVEWPNSTSALTELQVFETYPPAVPEPTTLAALGLGMTALLLRRVRTDRSE